MLFLLFTPSLITLIFSTINSISLNYHVSSRSRTLLLVLSLKLLYKSCHITPILRSLHWLRITECIRYKLLSLTYEVLTTTQPTYLHNLISVQGLLSTRSSSIVTLARPPTPSALKVTDRFFRYASPCLWNPLPSSLRQPHSGISSFISNSPIPLPITSCSFDSLLSSSITLKQFWNDEFNRLKEENIFGTINLRLQAGRPASGTLQLINHLAVADFSPRYLISGGLPGQCIWEAYRANRNQSIK